MNCRIISFLSYLTSSLDTDTISNTIRDEAKKQLPEIFQQLSCDDQEYFWNVTQLPDILPSMEFDDSKITSIIYDILESAQETLPLSRELTIIILPTFYRGFLEELDGVMGYAPTIGSTIFLNINTTPPNWEKSLQDTVAHEYHHVVIHEHYTWETIGQILIYEGLAEHFRDAIVGGSKSPWIEKIDKTYEKELLSFVQEFKDNWYVNAFRTERVYDSLFLGDDNHPDWLGYSLGYIIIRDIQYIHSFSWQEISQKDPFQLWSMWLEIKKR